MDIEEFNLDDASEMEQQDVEVKGPVPEQPPVSGETRQERVVVDKSEEQDGAASPDTGEGSSEPEDIELDEPDEPENKPAPYQFKVGDLDVAVDDVTYDAEKKTLTFTEESFQKQISPFIQQTAEMHAALLEAQEEARRASASMDENQVRAKAFITKITALMDKGPEAVAEWLDNLDEERQKMEKEIKDELLQQKLQSYESREQEEMWRNRVQAVVQDFNNKLPEILEQNLFTRFKALPQKFREESLTRFRQQMKLSDVIVPPSGNNNKFSLNWNNIDKWVDMEYQHLRRIAQVARDLKRSQSTAPTAPPPAVGSQPPKPTGGKQKPQEFKSPDEFQEWFFQ